MKSYHKIAVILFAILSLFAVNPSGTNSSSEAEPLIDSLITSLKGIPDDTNKVNILNKIAYEFYPPYPDSTIIYGQKALLLSQEMEWEKGAAEAYNNIGAAYRYKSEIKKSIENHKEALKLFESLDDLQGKARSLSQIGICYYFLSDFSNSYESFYSAFKIYSVLNNDNGIANNSSYMGIVQSELKNYELALNHFSRAQEIYEGLGLENNLATQYGNIGLVYYETEDYSKALDYFEKCLSILNRLEDLYNISIHAGNLGLVYTELGQFEKADSLYNRSLRISEEFDDKYGVAHQYGNKGKNFLVKAKETRTSSISEKSLDKSIFYLNKAVKEFKEMADKEQIINYLFLLSEAYELDKKYELALSNYKIANAIQDSIFSSNNQKMIAELEYKQQVDVKEKEIEILNKEKEKQRIINIFLITIVILVAIAGVTISLLYIKIMKRNKALNENIRKREEVEESLRQNEIRLKKYQGELENLVEERTINLQKALDSAERANQIKSHFLAQMSHEIRTPLNTVLNFTSIIKDNVAKIMNSDLKESFLSIERAGNRLIRTVDLILNVSELETNTYELSPAETDLGSDILNNIVKEYRNQCELKGIKLISDLPKNLPKIYIDQYSVTQIFANLIDNAVKYTHEGEIRVTAEKSDKKLVVLIKDTGIGMTKDFQKIMFDVFTQEEEGYTRSFEGNGLGLSLVKRYSDINNLEIDVDSEKNQGTTISIIFKTEETQGDE